MNLTILPGQFSILKYAPDKPIPSWLVKSSFSTITKTPTELSVVCETEFVHNDAEKHEANWKCLKVEGPLDFSLTGILSSLAHPLAEAKISIFAISTFETDYILVKEDKLSQAQTVLAKAGFNFGGG